MSNTNNNLQTQTSNALLNAIMDAGGKDRSLMLAHGIDNDIYTTLDACPNACESWKANERLKQDESINAQDFETNLYWEFRKFTSKDGKTLESYYLRFYKMMNELVRNRNRFVTLVKHCQDLKNVSYHKLYDILKQHQNEVNEIRPERLARTVNPLSLVAQQQLVYHPQNHPTHYTQDSSTRPQQAATKNKDDALSKEKEIDKLMNLISLSFKKIYKPTNNNLRTSSNTTRANRDNTSRINRGTREFQKLKQAKDAANHKEKMLLCKQEEAGFQLNAEQYNWRDDTDNEPEDQVLEAHYLYMAHIQEVTPDAAKNSGPIFNVEPLQKELFAYQESNSITSQEKEAQNNFYKTREDKEIKRVIAVENKVKVSDDIVYKTGQSAQTMNMLNRKCKTIFVKPEFLKKAHRVNPRLYDIGCYNYNLTLMSADRGLSALFATAGKKKRKSQRTISKTGVAKSYPGSFPQRGLNDLAGIKRI
nr:hypothetical protein [Tanacetum cinerariifolium]